MQLRLQVVQTKIYYLSSMAPSVFTSKVTSTSADGIEAVSLQLQGDVKVARKITVGIATPSVGGAAGDVVLSASPLDSGYAGWIFTTENKWRRFGLISSKNDETIVNADKIGIGTTNPATPLEVSGGDIKLQTGSSTIRRIYALAGTGSYSINSSGGSAIAFP